MTADIHAEGGYFAIVPEWLLDADVSGNAVKLYAILRRYADQSTLFAHPSRRTLAERMRFSRIQSVDSLLQQLADAGAIEVFERWTDRGDRDANGYRVLTSPPATHPAEPADTEGVVRETAPPPVRSTEQGYTRDRTGGGASERTTGSAVERTTVVRETAHKPEPPEPEPLEPENPPSADADGAPAPSKRGSRIAEPFIVTRPMRQWAADEVPDLDVDASTRMFVDHFRGAAGRSATKRDWLATWRNWLRRDHQQRTRGAPHRETSTDRIARQYAETRASLDRLTDPEGPDHGHTAGMLGTAHLAGAHG